MKKNHSLSLPKISNNLISNRSNSRIQAYPNNRLNYPLVGDSGYYGNAGRKHYYKNSDFIHRLILNPDYGKKPQQISRSKSQTYLKMNPEAIQKQPKKKLSSFQQIPLTDSLTKLEQQFNKKLTTEGSPQKNQKNLQIPVIPNTQLIRRKSSSPYNISHMKIFGNIDNEYQSIQNPGSYFQLNPMNRRKFNPTFLSSELGYV